MRPTGNLFAAFRPICSHCRKMTFFSESFQHLCSITPRARPLLGHWLETSLRILGLVLNLKDSFYDFVSKLYNTCWPWRRGAVVITSAWGMEDIGSKPGANPTILSYNKSSVVKIYNATNSLPCYWKKFRRLKTLYHTTALALYLVLNSEVVGLAPGCKRFKGKQSIDIGILICIVCVI
jgi:hypothetical protein